MDKLQGPLGRGESMAESRGGWEGGWDLSQSYLADRLVGEERDRWYDSVALDYAQTRPRYPAILWEQVLEAAQLGAGSRVLEIGCGPGIATVDWASRGLVGVALEPSGAGVAIARAVCGRFPGVSVEETNFEDWDLAAAGAGRFDGVMATTSFHWLSPEVRYAKTAAALRSGGSLVLLWNVPPQPNRGVMSGLAELYGEIAPELVWWDDRAEQEEQLRAYGVAAVASGLFEEVGFMRVDCDRAYGVADYLRLLGTLSPYIALEPERRGRLLGALAERLGGLEAGVETSYFSAGHVLRVR